MKQQTTRVTVAMRYTVTITLTVLFLTAVILFNVLFTALADQFGWYFDMSQERLTEIGDVSVQLITDHVKTYEAQTEKTVRYRILFCAQEETVRKHNLGSYVLSCAENYARQLPFVELKFLDMATTPEGADPYLSATVTALSETTLIVEAVDAQTGERLLQGADGGYRVSTFANLFYYNAKGTLSGFGGEYRLTSMLLGVLGERPIAVFTTGNGEKITGGTSGLYNLVEDSGFSVQMIDLEQDALPEETSLVVVNAPDKDLNATELAALKNYSEAGGHLMIFLDPLLYNLPSVSAALADFGVRFEAVPGYIQDASSSLAASSSMYLCGIYAEEVYDGTPAKGTELVSHLRDGNDHHTVFPKACAISKTEQVGENGRIGETDKYLSALFTTTNSAMIANQGNAVYGKQLLMTITEDRASGATTLICASPDVTANNYLLSASYNNRELFSRVLADMEDIIGDTRIAVRFLDDQSLRISASAADMWTAVLILVLPIAVLTLGTVVYIRRRHL